MNMQGQRTLTASQQQAWDALNNAEVLKVCIPGCEKFEPTGDNAYAIVAALKIGPVAARFTGKVQLTDIEAPHRYKLNFDAQGGVAGFGKGQSSVELKPAGSGCELHYTVHSSVGGKIAQMGQRLIDGVAKNLAEDFFKRFEAELVRLYPVPATAAAPTAAPPPKPAPGAASGGLPAWVWVAAAAAVAAAVWFAAR